MRKKIKPKEPVGMLPRDRQKSSRPNVGDTKTEIRFAFLPIKIRGYKVWLERYKMTYEYKDTYRRKYILPRDRTPYDREYEIVKCQDFVLTKIDFYKNG